MLSWGERGKRKWEGPGVNHAGWEVWLPLDRASQAWMQGPGLCLTLPSDGVLVPRHRCLAWACLCIQAMGSWHEAKAQAQDPLLSALSCSSGKYLLGLQPQEQWLDEAINHPAVPESRLCPS